MHVLIVEDETRIREGIAEMLRDEGYETSEAGTLQHGLEAIGQRAPDVVLSDIHLPDGDGFSLLAFCEQQPDDIPVIFMTAFGSRELALQAIEEGACDYITKPIRFDELFARLARLGKARETRDRIAHSGEGDRTGNDANRAAMLGDSRAMRRVRNIVDKAAGTDAPVLITGETGVGKGLVARLIHDASPRASHPFLRINCASIPDNLLESELFGYRKGAFTGAERHRRGLLEEVGDGTLFLDEIGDMPLPLQAKLLHVLDDGVFRPLGGDRDSRFSGRIVAATNITTERMLAGDRFRTDLYYRLSVLTIEIPPLRERPEDILPLAEKFYRETARKLGKDDAPLPSSVAGLIQTQSWPGNVRQLRNYIERLLILDDTAHDARDAAHDASLAPATRRFERAWIRRVINECGGDKAEAAKRLGIGLSTLYRKLEDA